MTVVHCSSTPPPPSSSSSSSSSITIGYASNPKKKRQFFLPFAEYCMREYGATCVDILEPRAETAPSFDDVDVLFMKVTDDMIASPHDSDSAKRLDAVKSFVQRYGRTVPVVEDTHKVERLLDRQSMYTFVHESLVRDHAADDLDTPPFVIIDRDTDLDRFVDIAPVQFPVICKTAVACGTRESHDMAVVFDREHLTRLVKDGDPIKMELPIIAQQFVNHDATLYKVYVIADRTFVQQRPSIRSFGDDQRDTLAFNSHQPFPLDMAGHKREVTQPHGDQKRQMADNDRFDHISSKLRHAMGIDLFGYDCVIDNKTGKCFVVDINYLPGYSGVQDLFRLLFEYLQQRVAEFRTASLPNDSSEEVETLHVTS